MIFTWLFKILGLLKDNAQKAWKTLPAEQQQAVINGSLISQVIKENIDATADSIIDFISMRTGLTRQQSRLAVEAIGQSMGLHNFKYNQTIDYLKGQADFIGDAPGKNALFSNIAKFAAIFLSQGKVTWQSLAYGLIQYAFEVFVRPKK